MRKKFLKNGVIAMMAVCGLAFVSCSEDNDEGMKSYKLTVSRSEERRVGKECRL